MMVLARSVKAVTYTAPNGKPAQVAAVPPKTKRPVDLDQPRLPSRNVPVGELKAGECKFPTSPGRPHRFCAQPAVGPKLRFCEHHQSIAIKREVKLIEEIAA